jgi:glycosyltransferase involved in cell wall biosynthesis
LVTVIPYGIEQQLFRYAPDDSTSRCRRLLFAGQFLPRKGSSVLKEMLPVTAARYPDASVTFVVPDVQMASVEAAFRGVFGARLSVLPWTTREKLGEIYRRHDILLFPSFFEGFGKVFLEAMAAGLCVVGFREGGLPDIATHSRDALLCETGDRHAFRILTECALADPAWTRQIGNRAREVARHYTWERHAIETENFCNRLRRSATDVPAGHLIDVA